MIIVKQILLMYSMHCISVVLHEMGHVIAGIILYRRCDEVCIGNCFYMLVLKKIKISPIVFTAYVGIDRDAIFSGKYYKVLIYFMAGPFMNLLLCLLLCLKSDSRYSNVMLSLNVIYCMGSILPIYRSDMRNLIKVVKYKRYCDSL